jgi:hypothetical protein
MIAFAAGAVPVVDRLFARLAVAEESLLADDLRSTGAEARHNCADE